MRAFDRWRALSRHQKWLTVESAALVALAAAAISIVGLQRLLAMASPGVRGRTLDVERSGSASGRPMDSTPMHGWNRRGQ